MLPSEAETCQVVYANKQTLQLTIDDLDADKYPAELYEPIGVVVIPGHHGVLKDENGRNQCGVVSIVAMNNSTPTIGGNNTTMYWGNPNIDIPTLINYTRVASTEDNVSNVATGLYGHYGFIPIQTSINGKPTRDSKPYSPSPYIGNDYKSGGYNSTYGTTEYDDSNYLNVLADFDGRGNTDKILAQRGYKDYNTWKPESNSRADYCAASCCDMFSTIGTEQGDWYLPAAGELGYIIPKLCDINYTISKLNNTYRVGVELGVSNYYFSSSEYSSIHAYRVSTSNGNVGNYSKEGSSRVRAFMRL